MAELYDYQREAVEKLKTGSILCGGVGSGKSRTSLAYYCELKGRRKDLYIITTARKRDTGEWTDECAPFDILPKAVDSWNNIKKYVDVKGAFFIFDEQRVVGYGAWTKAFLKIARANDWILLSATPGDTWMDYLPVFIANGFYKNKRDFTEQHVIWSPYTKYPQVKSYFNQGKLIRHRNDILVKMNYKKHTESMEQFIECDYDRGAYHVVAARRWNIYDNCPIVNAAECCYVLRKIVNSHESRLAKITELLGKHPKAIIFYNYDYELELLRKTLSDSGFIFSEWNGHRHEPIPETDRWAYLVQYTAGAEGWNCTETDTLIFYSQNYSYKIMTQAAGRIDRMNTPFKTLWYYTLRSSSPIDRAISGALKRKKNFNESKFLNYGKDFDEEKFDIMKRAKNAERRREQGL